MKSPLANLTSMERRFVVGVGVVVFIVLNLLFVWPRFKDWGKLESRLKNAQARLGIYEAEIRQSTNYQKELMKLKGEGISVAAEDQPAALLTTIQNIAIQTGVTIQSSQQAPSGTNQFFMEQAYSLTLTEREESLVNFLHQLGANSTLIRVRDLALRPDQPRQRLTARLKVVASYQRQTAAKASPTASAAATTVPRPTTPR